MNNILLQLLLYLNIISLIIGFILGKLINTKIETKNYKNSKNNKFSIDKKNNIEIDDKKVVLNINTDGLEKKYDSLGDVTSSDTNINNSINKLKNLKR